MCCCICWFHKWTKDSKESGRDCERYVILSCLIWMPPWQADAIKWALVKQQAGTSVLILCCIDVTVVKSAKSHVAPKCILHWREIYCTVCFGVSKWIAVWAHKSERANILTRFSGTSSPFIRPGEIYTFYRGTFLCLVQKKNKIEMFLSIIFVQWGCSFFG